MAVGFIGLGTMGLPMAKCLQRQGIEIYGWDVSEAALRAIGNPALSIEALCADCDQIVTMLPEGEHVEAVYAQIFAAGPNDRSLFIDCSTIDVDTTRKLAQRVTAAGHDFVDAPVSGGSEAAANGSLSFMIGGAASAIERARPLLAALGGKLTEFGEAGAGQAAKACHNMICGITALGVCEAFALAEALGLDLDKFFQLCSGAAAQSWILENRCPVPGPAPAAPAANGYAPGFAARLMAKDLGLAQQAAAASGQPTEFGAAAARRFREFVETGAGDLDFSAIYRSIRK
jgi:3-hydroxyisobutyrate dehydrogenase